MEDGYLLFRSFYLSELPVLKTSKPAGTRSVMVQWVALTPGFDSWPRYSPHCYHRADSRLGPSQWETLLQSNTVSHWLGANLVSALLPCTQYIIVHYYIIIILVHYYTLASLLNTLGPGQNRRHFADDIFKCIFLNGNVWISIKISLKFVPKGPINNIPALVQIMAWHRLGDKPLPEPIMVSLLMHITRPQFYISFFSLFM